MLPEIRAAEKGDHMASNGQGKKVKNGGSQKSSSNGKGPRAS